MIEVVRKYYEGYPLCFEKYELTESSLIFHFINVNEELIENVKVAYGSKEYIIAVNSKDYLIKAEIDDIDPTLVNIPQLIYVTIGNKQLIFDDFRNNKQLIKIKSVSYLGREKYLFIRNVNKNFNIPKDKIMYIPMKTENYWGCTCGHYSFGKQNKCLNCGVEKKDIFSVKTIYDKEAHETTGLLKGNILYSLWTLFLFMGFFLSQMIFGDFLFDNHIKNEFFGVLNRVIVPLLILGSSISILLALHKYQGKLLKVSSILRAFLILYLNFMFCFFTIHLAYDTIFIIGMNCISLGYIIYVHTKVKSTTISHLLVSAVYIILFAIGGLKLINFSKYSLSVVDGGIALDVYTDEVEYSIPEEIDSVKVISVKFDKEYDYNIKKLNVSKNLKYLNIYSNEVLDKLETLSLNNKNKYFELKDNILYDDKGIIKLVPTTVKYIEIENEVLGKNALHYSLGLEEVVIKNSVKEIQFNAFYGCPKLKKVTFENNSTLTKIDSYAFGECVSLESIDIPESVETLGVGILYKCESLKSVKTPFIGEKRETEINDYAATDLIVKMFGPGDYKNSHLIPMSLEKIEIFDIVLIHNVTFYDAQNIKHIILPETLQNIGIRSFYNCKSLEEFTVPSGITVIKESCFENCISLKKIIIPESVKEISINAFKNCTSLEEVVYQGDINSLIIHEGNDTIKNLLIK